MGDADHRNEDPWCTCWLRSAPDPDCPRHGDHDGPVHLSEDDREFMAMLDAFTGDES